MWDDSVTPLNIDCISSVSMIVMVPGHLPLVLLWRQSAGVLDHWHLAAQPPNLGSLISYISCLRECSSGECGDETKTSVAVGKLRMS